MSLPRVVLHVVTGLPAGGARTVVCDLARGLGKRGYVNHLVVFRKGNVWRRHEVQPLFMEIHELNVRHRLDVMRAFRLRSILERVRPEIVHTHLIHASILARPLSRRVGVPLIVTTEHNLSNPDEKGALLNWLNRQTYRWCDATIAISDAVRAQVIEAYRIPRERVHVVRNGIYISDRMRILARDIWMRRHDSCIVLGTLARLERRKGVPVLIHAAGILKEKGWPVRVRIAGEGPDRPRLKALVRELGLEQRVEFLGWREDVYDEMGRWSIYVQPSLSEGLGIGILEAMAVGLPVVASRTGGIPEIVQDGVTGILVPPDNPEALAAAVETLLSSKEHAVRLGKAGFERVRLDFAADKMVEDVIRVYNQGLRRKQRHSVV